MEIIIPGQKSSPCFVKSSTGGMGFCDELAEGPGNTNPCWSESASG